MPTQNKFKGISVDFLFHTNFGETFYLVLLTFCRFPILCFYRFGFLFIIIIIIIACLFSKEKEMMWNWVSEEVGRIWVELGERKPLAEYSVWIFFFSIQKTCGKVIEVDIPGSTSGLHMGEHCCVHVHTTCINKLKNQICIFLVL